MERREVKKCNEKRIWESKRNGGGCVQTAKSNIAATQHNGSHDNVITLDVSFHPWISTRVFFLSLFFFFLKGKEERRGVCFISFCFFSLHVVEVEESATSAHFIGWFRDDVKERRGKKRWGNNGEILLQRKKKIFANYEDEERKIKWGLSIGFAKIHKKVQGIGGEGTIFSRFETNLLCWPFLFFLH